MRAFCTVSAPLEVCASSAEQLSPGSRFLALRLLGNQQPKTLYFLVDAKSRVREVYTQTCLHFATQGMLDTELFGLAVLIDGEYMFADPESKLSKYGPKSWRSSHTHGLDANGRPLLELHFRVQFYIESPFMLKDETSRHNYYLQLKYNALQRDIPKEYSDQSMILLAGLALQADLGDAAATTTTTKSAQKTNNVKITGNTTAATTKTTTTTVVKTNSSASHDDAKTSDTTSTTVTTAATTTLPKINKRTNSEKVLRLSTYATPASACHATSTSISSATTTTSTATSSTTSSSATSALTSVFPISGSLKRSLNAVATTLSPSTSTSSINRSASTSTNGSTPPHASAVTATSAASPLQIDYFCLDHYLPPDLRNAWAASALRACHRENRGMSTADAELHYIQQACLVHESINAHTFRMRMLKNEHGPGNSWFVVYAKGIKIYGVGDNPQQQMTFLWPNITKLSFERKKFEIRSGESKITLYATSDEKNKMLLTLCKETHQFSMKIAARLKEVIKREEEESNCLHACYIYSRSLHLPYKNKNDQRISVISSTSSNTTSGIVSDRVHSEDELEIMINTPPAPIAAPSTESLALAHLLDRPSVSRQTSSVGQVSLKELEDQLVALSVRQQQQQQQQRQRSSNSGEESPTDLSNVSAGNSSTSSSFPTTSQGNTDSSTTTDSPSSQHNVGSQCSSTCSTVVVASPSDCNSGCTPLSSLAVSASTTAGNRRNSTSSSLELGFSHTAQNSTLSETGSTCIEHEYHNNSTQNDETESVSGVYTLAHGAPPTETSGVYTMHSSEMTGQSSEIAESESQASSHYGIFQPSKSVISDDDNLRSEHSNLDSVDGGGSVSNYHGKRIKNEEFRLRSDSNISTSGSFRGDGSDPTDSKHTLLSAEELTDLIVGRGTYPCRKTVSNTLDSDCDYVTLPLSMKGDSYIPGHQDTAPTDDHVVDDLLDVLLPADPPAPPQRIDSNALNRETLANLSNIRVRSPPPYNARHEKTGLCGPPLRSTPQHSVTKPVAPAPPAIKAIVSNVPSPIATPEPTALTSTPVVKTAAQPRSTAAIRRREPPPYPASAKPRPTSLVSLNSTASSSAATSHPPLVATVSGSMTSLKSEEITARFITTRPHINILKAHTSVVNEHSKPSYAAPTHCSSSAASSTGSLASSHHHLSSQLSQHSANNSNYAGSTGHQLSSLHHLHHHHLQHAPPPLPAANASQMSAAAAAHVAAAAAAGAGVIPSTIGIPLVPYSLHAAHKSMSSLHQHPPPPPPPYPDMKPQTRTCVLLPVIKPRQYLPPPPPSLPRQPPPPPPPQLATVYSSQLARKQLELYQQQLYSDVDYVIYPIQDPAVSQQEYLDAKQGSILAAMAQNPPPPHPYLAYHHHHAAAASAHAGAWDTCKGHAIYRSTPYLPLALSTHSRYASTQNLSDTYVQLPGTYSPLYSPSVASLCSSYEPPPPPPLHPAALAMATASTSNLFARSRSDDNILNSLDSLPKVKRLPPPPPPPYVNRRLKKPPMPAPTEKPPPIPSKPVQSSNHITSLPRSQFPPPKPPTLNTNRSNSHMTKTSSGAQWAGERPKPDSALSRGGGNGSSSILAHLQASVAAANMAAMNAASATKTGSSQSAAAAAAAAANAIDIAVLREKSRNLDLPLISALCNDRSLLKQTKAFVPPKNSRHASSTSATATAATAALATATGNHSVSKSLAPSNSTTVSAAAMNGSSVAALGTSQQQLAQPATSSATATPTTNNKYSPASQLTKPRKTSISHRHPNDKLPPLPMQLAEANNYVMDPAILRHHKSYNSQT